MTAATVQSPRLSFWRDALPALRNGLRPLLAYQVLWKILTLVLLGPLTLALLHTLVAWSGEAVVANSRLLSFVLSPLGLTTLVIYATLALTGIFVEQAGLMVILVP